jgi:hypothetical protein
MSEGIKNDDGKARTSLLSSIALLELSKVMSYGAKKYSDHNWRKGFKYSRLMDAAMRHLFAYNGGERIDPETGLSHLAHCMANLMMLVEFETTKAGEDDLYSPEVKKELTQMSFFVPNGMDLQEAVHKGEALVINSDYITGGDDCE